MTPLRFDTRPWRPVRADVWVNADGDHVVVDFLGAPPDLPAHLDDQPGLRRRVAERATSAGSCLVELEPDTLDGVPALRQITKVPLPDREGVGYIASYTVPRAGCSVVLRLQCVEQGLPGLRDVSVFDRFMAARMQSGLSMAEVVREWESRPCGAPGPAGLVRTPAEDPVWDQFFPGHPLSRARRTLLELAWTTRLDPLFKAMPPFPGPAARAAAGG